MQKKVLEDQRERAFFDPTPDRKYPNWPPRPTEKELIQKLESKSCPLNEIVVSEDNEGNMRTIRRNLFTAMKRYNHSMRGMSMGIFAGSGQGKSFIAKQIVKAIELPLVFLQASAIDDNYSIFSSMREVCEKHGTPMVPQATEYEFTCPSMVVVIDEAHALKPKLMKAGLLNAMEADDGWMACSVPGCSDTLMVDCRNVCWIACTTERGVLFDAFCTRLATHINWNPAGEKEIADIVKRKMDKYANRNEIAFSLPLSAAELVAKYRRVPREAISFARKVIQEKDMYSSHSWEECVSVVASDMDINEWGMTSKEVAVLSAVGQRPISKNNLITIAACRIEELERYVLPPLFAHSNGGPLVVSTSRGCTITRSGLARLDEMSVPNGGDSVTVEYYEEKKR